METTTLASRTILAKGVINAALGAVHIAGAFTFEARKIAGLGTPELRRDYLVWFAGVGVFILFSAIIDLMCVSGLRASSTLSWRISLFSAIGIGLFGTFGVSIYGISPPLVLLVTGAMATVALLWTRDSF